MGLGISIERAFQRYRTYRRQRMPGPVGDFVRAGGNDLLWSSLPLTQDDVVIDAGGFQGDWTSEILRRYGCRSIIFEPLPEMAEKLRRLFQANQRVEIIEGGLGGISGSATLSLMADGSSMLRGQPSGATVHIKILGVCDFLQSRNLDDIGCLKINIEGAEYDLVDELIARKQVTRARTLLIQFHDFVESCKQRRENIQSQLMRTHQKVFDYAFVWEMWKRKPV